MGRDLDAVLEKDKKRYRLLRQLYEATEGNRRVPVDFNNLARQNGFTEEDARDAPSYLSRQGLVDSRWLGDAAAMATITHRGVVEVEQSIRRPATATDHFTPAVIQQHFHALVGSVQNAPHSTARVMQTIGADFQRLVDLVAELRGALETLPPAQHGEAADLVDGPEAEAKAEEPSISAS